MSLVIEIESIILENIPNAMVIVHNINDDGEHFEAIVISEKFDNIPLLKQHQMVMKPLREAFDTKVHALGLKTFGLNQWNIKKELNKMVSSREIDSINNFFLSKGALGGKVIGAGGGGFLLVIANQKDHKKLKKNLSKFLHVPFDFEFGGSSIIYHDSSQ